MTWALVEGTLPTTIRDVAKVHNPIPEYMRDIPGYSTVLVPTLT